LPRLPVIAAAFIAIAAISAIAVSAVYVNEGARRNVVAPGPRSPAGDAERPGPDARIAAFVVHAGPRDVAPVSFMSEDGVEATLESWRGRTVLVNLWATWCAPCRQEMPALDRLQARLGGDGFEVVAISLDRGGIAKSRRFFDEIGVEHLKLYSDATSKVSAALAVVGMPTTLLIDRDGREIGRLAGPAEWDSPEAVEMITRLAGVGS